MNVAADLAPFQRINPCGLRGLEVTRLSDLGGPADVNGVAHALVPHLLQRLRYSAISTTSQAVSSR
jgi:lipoyl(octanoyl) transferase